MYSTFLGKSYHYQEVQELTTVIRNWIVLWMILAPMTEIYISISVSSHLYNNITLECSV